MACRILLTLAASAAAGLFLRRRRVPAGMLIGAIAGAALLSALGVGYVPRQAKTVSQLVAGIFIGCSASRDDLRQLRDFYKPVLVVTVSLLLLNLVIGTALYAISYGDLLTCLICAVPGGISDVTLIAVDLGTDPSKVLVIHFFRLVVGVVVFPLLVNRFTPPAAPSAVETAAVQAKRTPKRNAAGIALITAASAAASYGGTRLGIPSAVILCSLTASFALHLAGVSVSIPQWVRRAAQVLSGAYIGCLLDPAAFPPPGVLLGALAITVLVLLADAYFFGRLMEKRFQVPLREGMMMLSPAGASDIALISADIGLNSPRLVLVQVFRLLVSTAIFPQLCLLLCSVWEALLETI